MEYPYLKKALDAAQIPHIKLGIDQQMRDFGQAATAIQAFADVLSVYNLFLCIPFFTRRMRAAQIE